MIELKNKFVLRKRKVYPLSREERRDMQVYQRIIEERVYQTF